MDRAFSGVCWPQCEIVIGLRKSRITSGWAKRNKHNQGEDHGVDCSDVLSGLLIETTIIPNHDNNKEMLEIF